MTKENETGPYFALVRGDEIKLGVIERHAKHYIAAIDALFAEGEIIGHKYFFFTDSQPLHLQIGMMVVRPSKIKREKLIEPIQRWYN